MKTYNKTTYSVTLDPNLVYEVKQILENKPFSVLVNELLAKWLELNKL